MAVNPINYNFAADEAEAEKRFLQFENNDPLPGVPCALLNSKDIYHYVRIASIVYPFSTAILEQKLKTASYEVDFLGTVYFTDENGEFKQEEIYEGKPFTLKKNTIVFVLPNAKFFLPNYIAIRFNLRINLVHKGLLLGTGPLVDPGFSGNLLIPLHNLTSKDYELKGGEGFIWIEFTKLSKEKHKDFEHWHNINNINVSFPPDKRNANAQDYFNESSGGKPAVSSIPGEVGAAIRIANDAKAASEKIKNIGWLAFVAIAISLVIGLVATWDVISSANTNITNATLAITKNQNEQEIFQKRIKALEDKMDSLSSTLEEMVEKEFLSEKTDKVSTQSD